MKKMIVTVALLGLATSAGLALAAGGMRGRDGMMPQGPMTLVQMEARVKEHFAKLDTNKDGFVERAEADAARQKFQAERRSAHFDMMDENKDGSISRDEFSKPHMASGAGASDGNSQGRHRNMGMRHAGKMRGGMEGPMGGRMMDRIDANKDGKVSLAEALAKPTEHFKAMDTNSDGTVTPEERQAAREKMRGEWRGKRAM